jgi:hypothetical protein
LVAVDTAADEAGIDVEYDDQYYDQDYDERGDDKSSRTSSSNRYEVSNENSDTNYASCFSDGQVDPADYYAAKYFRLSNTFKQNNNSNQTSLVI